MHKDRLETLPSDFRLASTCGGQLQLPRRVRRGGRMYLHETADFISHARPAAISDQTLPSDRLTYLLYENRSVSPRYVADTLK